MKRIVYLFVVILLFLQSGGMLMFYKMEQQIQQHRMKRMPEQKNLQLEQFTLSEDVFTKCKTADDEIMIDGHLYDVQYWSIQGNAVKLTVIRDKAEELILKAIKNALKTSSQPDNGLLVRIVKLISLDYSIPSLLQIPALLHNIQKRIPIYSEIIDSRIPDILTPPPKLA